MAGKKESKTIGDYVELQRGKTYKSKLKDLPGPYLLGLASIGRNGGFRNDKLVTYGGDCPENLLVRTGELFVSLKDVTQSADLLGSVARVPSHIGLGRLTQDTVKLIFKSEDIPSDYIYWLLRTPQYRAYCRSNATGTTNLGLAREDFLSFEVPPLTRERELIVELLESLSDKIELNRRMNETLESMARALFKSWFVDFDPVRAKMDGRQPPGLPPATAALFPDSFEHAPSGELIPTGWKLGTVKDEFNLTMGQSPPGSTYNEDGEGLPFFQGRRDFGFRFPTRRVYCTAPTRFAEAGDTLVSVRAPVGDLNMAIERCCAGRGVAAVRHRTKSRSFTYYAMQHLEEDFARFEAEGTVFGSINKTNFESLEVLIPGDRLVESFEGVAGPIDQRVENQTREIATLAALRDSLLPRLLSGELRVAQVEELVSETV